jgi:hypothetical protein
MENISNCILKLPIFRKGTMSTLMGKNPKSHGNCSSYHRVGKPKWKGEWIGRVKNRKSGKSKCCTESSSHNRHREISERLGSFGLETVGGDNFGYLLPFGKVLISERKSLTFQSRECDSVKVDQGTMFFASN